MKLKSVSCTQFAGARDKSVTFSDGLNVVCGKNESGKSTLVNLISRTLFQNVKLNRRTDKDFFELYFPAAKKGGIAGDFADGRVSFEANGESYTLSKEWGGEARCTLSTPDAVIRDGETVDALVKAALGYGEGVYNELLLSSQRNTDEALKALLDATKKTDGKQQLTDAVSQALAASDGVSVDAIEQAINAKISEIAGAHWDFERDAPVRRGSRWNNSLGEILRAYYNMEEKQAVLDRISELEAEADRAAAVFGEADKADRAAEAECERFTAYSSRLTLRAELGSKVLRLNRELSRLGEIAENWPRLASRLETAKALQKEKQNRELSDKYALAKGIMDEIAALDAGAAGAECPTGEEIARVKAAQRAVARLENSLCGMNITAAVDMLGGHEVKITSLRTGEELAVTDGTATLAEAVKITVPGVMELQLAPANVDVSAIEADIARHKADAEAVLTKYDVSSADALDALAKTVADAKNARANAEARLALSLGGVEFGELASAALAADAPTRPGAEIERDIAALCRGAGLDASIAKAETLIDGYAAEYGGLDALRAKAAELETELKKAREAAGDAEDIPLEYLGISDVAAQLEYLQGEVKASRRRRETALTAKTAASERLESYKEDRPGDPIEDAEKAAREFAEQRSLLHHWLHIAEVFKAQKETVRAHPMQGLADAFAANLADLTGGRVSSEFAEPDRLSMSIYSAERLIDYGKLSEGTKDSVSLAFRLAVLDHLFPDGGGVIVFDDPFTDMDDERAKRASALIRKCAERHQVIFLTCKEGYLEALGGNVIRF